MLRILFFLLTVNMLGAQSIDIAASNVNFNVSNMAFNTVNGTLGEMKGLVVFNPLELADSKFEVCVDVESIKTGNKKRDEHLLKEDFFDVENYPEICYSSSSILKKENYFESKGVLKMKGIEKELVIPFAFENESLKGTIEIDRFDFGIGGKGGFMVGRNVEITIECVLKE